MVTKFMTTEEFLQWCTNYVKEDIQALIDKGDFKAVGRKVLQLSLSIGDSIWGTRGKRLLLRQPDRAHS